MNQIPREAKSASHLLQRNWPLRGLWLLVALLLLGLISLIGFKMAPMLKPALTERAALAADCDVRESPCQLVFSSGATLELDIRPRGIPTVTPLEVLVQIQGLARPLSSVELDFRGLDMNMGFNRVALEPLVDEEGGGAQIDKSIAGVQTYRGKAMLPVCVRDRMTWEALVLVDTPEGLLGAPFRFETFR